MTVSKKVRPTSTREARFRALVENSWDAIAVFGTDGRILYGNHATERVLGYSLDELVNRNAFDFILPDAHELVTRQLRASVRRPAERVQVSAHFLHKDGSWRLLEGRFTNMMDDPNVGGIVYSYRDMTEQRRNEERVGWLTLAVDQGPASVIMTDVAGKIVYVNQKFTDDTGYTSGEVLGKKPSVLKSGLTPVAQYAMLWRTIKSGKQYRGEMQNRRKSGELYWNDVQISPVKDRHGAITHFLGVQTDITERREAQLALEESLERFRKLTEASFDAICISQDGIIREVNRGLVELLGFDREDEVVGQRVVDLIAPQSVEEVNERVTANIEGTYELVVRRRDGKTIVAEATAKSQTIGGNVVRITALRDLTERRVLEEQFRQAQKMEAVGRLAGGVAHDFNNLMTVITGFTDMLLAQFGHGDPRRADLEEVRRAAEAAATLTGQLLAFSRQQVIEPKVVVLEDVVRQTQKLLTHLIGEDIELATQFGSQPCVVCIDPGQLEQVIMNLVVNSRDAMPTGGKLTIETAVVDLDEDYASAHWPATTGRYAMLAVSDTGVGMDESIRGKIFEPFFTTKEPGKGTGLGLATVYGIVKQNAGFIWAYSEPGNGATFKIYLPLWAEAPPPTCEQPARQSASRGTETVLLVEDSPAVRNIARRTLEHFGYDVIDAPSAAAALELVASLETPVHLLLTDVVMPEMSGRVLAEKFASFQPNTKVLYMSGYTDDAIIRHGVLSAKTPFLQKPFTPSTLTMRVREVLDS